MNWPASPALEAIATYGMMDHTLWKATKRECIPGPGREAASDTRKA